MRTVNPMNRKRIKDRCWMVLSLSFVICQLSINVACGTMTSAERAERALAVENALATRHYAVSIQVMYPTRGGAVNVTPDFSLKVEGDTLVSYLPYFGRAYNVPPGGGKGLNFTAPIKRYEAAKDKKGRTHVLIVADNDEDVITYHLEIVDNGRASIDVRCRERESISYSGELE